MLALEVSMIYQNKLRILATFLSHLLLSNILNKRITVESVLACVQLNIQQIRLLTELQEGYLTLQENLGSRRLTNTTLKGREGQMFFCSILRKSIYYQYTMQIQYC
ncbi:unnamed protein product [Moneuplotes crassus]|uniref:Uncharacterized protein n=1 Tax=Euplotes crassus TaxID=5936 RepID=A0AAD1Y0H2_EUPCR|nr:unnamed protein product [Moneuplotes crassus]